MSFLDEFIKELEEQVNYFINLSDNKSSKRAQEILIEMDKYAKMIENEFENGNLTPISFIQQINNFINIDKNNLKVFEALKFTKAIRFIKARLESLEKDKQNLQSVIDEE
jgi:hypothetical protein